MKNAPKVVQEAHARAEAAQPGGELSVEHAGARNSDLRHRNLALVFQQVLAADQPPSRAVIAALTGLTRSTVSRLVDELIAGNLLRELDAVGTGRAGRPALPLRPSGKGLVALGMELNVNHLSVLAMDLAGDVIASRDRLADHTGTNPEEGFVRLAGLAREVLDEVGDRRLAGVGVAVPGLVSVKRGLLLRAPNLGWREVPVAEILRTDLKLSDSTPVVVGNEADQAAISVAMPAPGVHNGLRDFFYISGEVGIGGAAVVAEEILDGAHGWAGEIGHTPVFPEGRLCGCGARGCLEAYAGATALCRMSDAEDIDAVAAAARSGSQAALQVLSEAGRALGIALSGAINLLDLPSVVLGGHLASLLEWIEPATRQELAERVLSYEFSPTQITTVDQPERPAALGSAVRAFQSVIERPDRWLLAR